MASSNAHLNSWKSETARYLSRVESLLAVHEEYSRTMTQLWPDQIWPTVANSPNLSVEQFTAFRTAVFCTGIVTRAATFTNLIATLWREGHFFALPLNVRYVFESWGMIHFAAALLDHADPQKALAISEQLLNGVKAEVYLPWGPRATEKAINIMEFIRPLDTVDAGAGELYAFLSAASHPNTLQCSYFSMMGPPLPNWSNERFKVHAHVLLEKTLAAHEQARASLHAEAAAVVQRAAKILAIETK